MGEKSVSDQRVEALEGAIGKAIDEIHKAHPDLTIGEISLALSKTWDAICDL